MSSPNLQRVAQAKRGGVRGRAKNDEPPHDGGDLAALQPPWRCQVGEVVVGVEP